ncbi:hypothetical protein SRIMM317S_00909 [Streptomyces rimosus subsp. rimosus]
MLASGAREGYGPAASRARVSSSRSFPSRTSSQLSKRTPSSWMVRLKAGMEPGVMPPISAWWPREATRNSSSRPASSKTGVTTVTSGRCVPPWYGSLTAYTSPGRRSPVPRRRLSTSLMDSPIDPRCTGMCGALAMRLPS